MKAHSGEIALDELQELLLREAYLGLGHDGGVVKHLQGEIVAARQRKI